MLSSKVIVETLAELIRILVACGPPHLDIELDADDVGL
jgi:hypothetical protein